VTEEVRELAALYALGALTQHEASAFEAHLREGCAICESELRRFEQTAAGIGLAAEEIAPPEYVRDPLLERIEREHHVPVLAAPTNPIEEKPVPEPALPLLSTLSKPQSKRTMSYSAFWFSQALMFALVVLCFGAIYMKMMISMKADKAQLQHELSSSQADVNDLRSLLLSQNEKSENLKQLLTVAGKPGVRIARLSAQPADPTFSGAVFWDTEQHRCLLMGSFPPPPIGRAYQLWLVVPSAKVPLPKFVSLGLFAINPANPTFTTVPVPEIVLDAVAVGITLEPDSGSGMPNLPYIISGRFN
jgi:hypothetical protein